MKEERYQEILEKVKDLFKQQGREYSSDAVFEAVSCENPEQNQQYAEQLGVPIAELTEWFSMFFIDSVFEDIELLPKSPRLIDFDNDFKGGKE